MPLTPLSKTDPQDFLKKVRLIATDMDGTLTRQGRFTADLLQALEALQMAQIPVLITTGRSAGWVSSVVNYLPIAGAIAENGGLFYPGSNSAPLPLSPIADWVAHRQALATLFQDLQSAIPRLQASLDNSFRLTDWTFDVADLSQEELAWLGDRCQLAGWGFTYSTVQCHIKPLGQDKGTGLIAVLQTHYPDYPPHLVVTVGDSPNDEELFVGDRFPYSVGVANVRHYADSMAHPPRYVTPSPEVDGFLELANALIHARLRSL